MPIISAQAGFGPISIVVIPLVGGQINKNLRAEKLRTWEVDFMDLNRIPLAEENRS